MKFRNTYIAVLLVTVLTVASCSKYDAPENQHWIDYGTAYLLYGNPAELTERPKLQDFYIERDDGVILMPKYDNWANFIPEHEQRVYLNYEILSEDATRAEETANYDVKVFYITDVKKKELISLSDTEELNVGNDPISRIVEMRCAGKYVNIIYQYPTANPTPETGKDDKHTLDLAVDTENSTEEEVVVYLRHSANGDTPQQVVQSNFVERKGKELSFDISGLIPEGKESVRIKFVWNVYTSNGWTKAVEKEKAAIFEPGKEPIKVLVSN